MYVIKALPRSCRSSQHLARYQLTQHLHNAICRVPYYPRRVITRQGLYIGGRRKRSEVDGLRESRVLRAPEHFSGGARARVGTCQRARAPPRSAERETPRRLDTRLC